MHACALFSSLQRHAAMAAATTTTTSNECINRMRGEWAREREKISEIVT